MKILKKFYEKLGIDTKDWNNLQLLFGEEYGGIPLLFVIIILFLL